MKQVICAVLIVLFLMVSVCSPSEAQQAAVTAPTPNSPTAEVPRLIKFSGALLDEQGQALKGSVGVTFALYAQQNGGAALWLETQNVKPDENGNYAVLLGANTASGVPAELFVSGEARWLGIQVGQQPEHERILLVSVPYALKAADAETLGGKPLSSFVLNEPQTAGVTSPAGKTHTAARTSTKTTTAPQPLVSSCASVTSDGTATANSIALFTTACNIQSSLMTQALINGFPGINLAGNNAGLLLNGTGTHQVTVTGATSGRLGQDANGFFFASDTNGKSVRFLTNNGTLNEWMRISSSGNVGIGTVTPAAQLNVVGSQPASSTLNGANAPTVLQIAGGKGGNSSNNLGTPGTGGGVIITAGDGGNNTGGAGVHAGAGGSITLQPGAGGTSSLPNLTGNSGDVLLAPSGGLVGIGTTGPDNALTVNGNADKPGGGSWGTFSDGRLKNIYGSFHSGLQQILQLNPIRYQYKEENPLGIHDTDEHIGLVAQEVEKVIPEAVSTNDKGYLLVNNDPILWSMLNAIKEQQGQIESQARQICAQQKQLRAQARQLTQLKARLEKQ